MTVDWDWIGAIGRTARDHSPAVLVTVARVTGSAPRGTGAKMLVAADGSLEGTIGGGNLENLAAKEALAVLDEGTPRLSRYPLGASAGQCCGGVVELLFEPLNTGPDLYLYGAGHVGLAVQDALLGTAFRVHLVDEREDRENLAANDWRGFNEAARWDENRIYAVVMTHRHDLDEEILVDLLRRRTKFLGLIGSTAKWRRFRDRLSLRGFTEAELSRVVCPVGLGIWGKAPKEVAISLAAQLLQSHYGSP